MALRLAADPADAPEVGIPVPEAARRLGCDPSTVRKFLRSGQLTGYKLNREYRVHASSIREFQSRPIGAEVEAAPRRRRVDHAGHREAMAFLADVGIRFDRPSRR
jgi:excisionase family DNA binding protein